MKSHILSTVYVHSCSPFSLNSGWCFNSTDVEPPTDIMAISNVIVTRLFKVPAYSTTYIIESKLYFHKFLMCKKNTLAEIQ